MLIQALRELAIADRRSDIEHRLTIVSSRKMLLSNKMADVAAQQLAAARNQIIEDETSNEGTDVTSVKNSDEYEEMYDFEISQIQAAELVLDLEKQRLETEYQALTAEEEGAKKLKDKNIEKSYGYFKS